MQNPARRVHPQLFTVSRARPRAYMYNKTWCSNEAKPSFSLSLPEGRFSSRPLSPRRFQFLRDRERRRLLARGTKFQGARATYRRSTLFSLPDQGHVPSRFNVGGDRRRARSSKIERRRGSFPPPRLHASIIIKERRGRSRLRWISFYNLLRIIDRRLVGDERGRPVSYLAARRRGMSGGADPEEGTARA